MDILFSGLLLLITWPLFIIIVIFIRLDSKGPAIFIQKRLTLNGRTFNMLKFRTMIINAETQGTGVYSFENDPRITRIGHILRKSSLDELLQLINVFKGDMSFVGPRPVLTYHPCTYEEYTYEEKQVFSVRPGITGWAQINGRNAVDWVQRFEMNEWYVSHVSFSLDLRIILSTFRQVFSKKDIMIRNETAKEFKEVKNHCDGEKL
ncbi:sugar transferase [Holdemania filiformis]|uniref:sugar transferase n=1 Tax=Holdemania filiformis TaxID=61171 RepID=UPI0024313E16|nr:sugar transferase [Holdemania filiformis]